MQSDLDALGDAASKLWNVARWTVDRVWDALGEIPDEATLKAYLKTRRCWKNLNAFSSQAIIEELSESFQSWFDVRHKDETANPPGYRKEHDTRPRSTVTFKDNSFKLDTKHGQVRLSKGENLKDSFGDFVLCEYDTRNDVDLDTVDTVQNVRAVWNGDEWIVHFVCKETIETPDSPGDGVAGVDLGVSNIAAVAFPDEYVLYPGNTIKQDNHYFQQREVQSSPTVVDGTVFVGSRDTKLYALDADTTGSSSGSRVRLQTLGHHIDTSDTRNTVSIPGFGIGSGITAIGATSYLLKRRLTGNSK